VLHHRANLRILRREGYLTKCQRFVKSTLPWGHEIDPVGPRPDFDDCVETEDCEDRHSHARIMSESESETDSDSKGSPSTSRDYRVPKGHGNSKHNEKVQTKGRLEEGFTGS